MKLLFRTAVGIV